MSCFFSFYSQWKNFSKDLQTLRKLCTGRGEEEKETDKEEAGGGKERTRPERVGGEKRKTR